MSCHIRFYGFKNFQYGITDLSKLTVTEYKYIMSILYLLVDWVCADDSDCSLAKGEVFVYLGAFILGPVLFLPILRSEQWSHTQ